MKEPKKNRVVRVEDALWDAAKVRAVERSDNLSEVIREFLKRYSR